MKKFAIALMLAGIVVFFQNCVKTAPDTTKKVADFYSTVSSATAGYDSVFAQKLGADEHGMQQYVMAFLKRGPNRNQDSLTAAQLQKAHMENIGRMAEAGKLVVAGPFMDTGSVRGIYIFNVRSVEEARQLTATDPAIQAGRLEMELHPWYGSAALPMLLPMHKRLEKQSLTK